MLFTSFHWTDDVATRPTKLKLKVPNMHNFNINLYVDGMLRWLPFSCDYFPLVSFSLFEKVLNDDKHSDSLFIRLFSMRSVGNRFTLRICCFVPYLAFAAFGRCSVVACGLHKINTRLATSLREMTVTNDGVIK